jgi:hypothetical protein
MLIRIGGNFALNPNFSKFIDLFMQLMHEEKPKPFHCDLGTKPIHPCPKFLKKILG